MSRILYMCPDVKTPAGGVDVIYSHVNELRKNNFDAYIVHNTIGFRYPYAIADIPVLSDDDAALCDSDIMVVSEGHAPLIHAGTQLPCKKILFCQNHFCFFDGIKPGESWQEFGFADYICVSPQIESALKKWFGITSSIIPPFIEDYFFSEQICADEVPIRIAAMPRKGAKHLRLVSGLIRAPNIKVPPNFQWNVIDNKPKTSVADILQRSHIFISTSAYEGLGLPPLEAMASGCLIIGFKGGGGLDYATDSNGIWVADEDPWQLTERLVEVLIQFSDKNERASIVAKRIRGQQTAKRYSYGNFQKKLINFWELHAERTL